MKNKIVLRLIISCLIFAITLMSGCTAPQTTPTTPISTPEAKVTGTVTYLEKLALPSDAIVEVKLLDISKQDAPAVTIGEQVFTTSGQQVPFSFEIKYNPATIDPRYTYAVRASITFNGNLQFTTDTRYAVITQGNPSTVAMVLKRVTTPTVVPALENTTWVLQSYGQSGNLKSVLKDTEITTTFDSVKGQVAGSAGVNRYVGGYELKDNKLSVSKQLAVTAMAGPQSLMDQEKEYLTALQATESYQIKDGQLQINCGQQLLIFAKTGSKELAVDLASSGKQVTLAAGDILTVTLESNITTGYSWNENATIGDKTVMQQTVHKYQSPATPIPGAGGKEVWIIKALKAGNSTISMEYRRSFEPGAAPAKTLTLSVVVR
jgi:putative lipoprotein